MSSIINVKNINIRKLLTELSFSLDDGDKIALVGQNRSGKSTLVKTLSSLEEIESGEIITRKGSRITYVSQEFPKEYLNSKDLKFIDFIKNQNKDIFSCLEIYKKNPNQEMYDYLENEGAFKYKEKLSELCDIFCFENYLDKHINTMSGGELKKLQLISALLFKSDLILLDEPTNHLDIKSIQELEKILQTLTIVVISHDRQFIDNLNCKIWELWSGRIYKHNGNFQKYLENKNARLEIEKVEKIKQDQWLKTEYKWVAAGVQARGTKDKGRLDRFENIKDTEKKDTVKNIDLILPSPMHLGNKILDIENVSVKLPNGKEVVKNFTFKFNKHDKIGILGANGSGKTTFLNAILNNKVSSGTVKIGQNTTFFYLDQNKQDINKTMTVFEYISEGKERLQFGLGEISTYKYLSNWLFEKDEYYSNVENLSGGQKSKLVMAKKLLTPNNFLILDEPTNDLDLDSIAILEKNLKYVECPVIVVSHDRRFLDQVCNIIFSFQKEGEIIISYGNYSDYLHKNTLPVKLENQDINLEKLDPKIKLNPKEQRQKEAKIREIENEISKQEEIFEKTTKILYDPKSEIFSSTPEGAKLLVEFLAKREKIEKKITELTEIWENMII
jgi:ABC transport system ATP-binding/permease protein